MTFLVSSIESKYLKHRKQTGVLFCIAQIWCFIFSRYIYVSTCWLWIINLMFEMFVLQCSFAAPVHNVLRQITQHFEIFYSHHVVLYVYYAPGWEFASLFLVFYTVLNRDNSIESKLATFGYKLTYLCMVCYIMFYSTNMALAHRNSMGISVFFWILINVFGIQN